MQKILLLGYKGQLGSALYTLFQQQKNINVIPTSSHELDITNTEQVNIFLQQIPAIDVIVNCIAYTNTKMAEKEKELAMAVNATALTPFVNYCHQNSVLFIQISSDFIFNGNNETPYLEDDLAEPLNVYGKSKLLAEQILTKLLSKYFIFRTSSLFSDNKDNNFLTKILARSSDKSLKIIADGAMSPTYSPDLAKTILFFILSDINTYGIYHATNSGSCSWHEFATYAFKQLGIATPIQKITATEWGSDIRTPKYSVLSNNKINQFISRPTWQDSVLQYLKART